MNLSLSDLDTGDWGPSLAAGPSLGSLGLSPISGGAGCDKVPMEVDGEHLTPAELMSVDLAKKKEFAKHVQTLAAEADAVFECDFEVKCSDAEHKDALHIMDIVSHYILFSYYATLTITPAIESSLPSLPPRWTAQHTSVSS